MFENRVFERHWDYYTATQQSHRRVPAEFLDIHAAMAVGRRERARAFGQFFGRAYAAVKRWLAEDGKPASA